MKEKAIISAIFLIFLTLASAPGVSYAQGGISGGIETAKTSLSIIERLEGFFGLGKELVKQGGQISSTVQETVEARGWKEVLGKVWDAIVSFFGDTTVRGLLMDTAKLFLHLVANIFTLIAGALNKILEAIGST